MCEWSVYVQINPGRDVPPEYYLTNLTETDKDEMDRVVIGRGGACELQYDVEVEGSLINWEFISTDFDVSYGLHHKTSTQSKITSTEVVSIVSLFSHCTVILFL